jgi:hypothetical protein
MPAAPLSRLPPACLRCQKDAPIVYRGVVPYCTACGALRTPLSSPSVNLAGRPSRVGGAFASVAGWLLLVCGGSLALGIALLFVALNLWTIGVAIALPIAIVALVVGIALVRGGRSLTTSGEQKERATVEQALLAMAAHRGAVTADEAARSLGVGPAEADAMLTALAKREPDRVAVEVDEQGVVWYRASAGPGEPIPRVRVEPGVRIDAPEREATHGEVESDDEASHRVAARAPR